MNYRITQEEQPTDEELDRLSKGIDEHMMSTIGSSSGKDLTLLLRDEEGLIAGGVHGNYGQFGWLYISTLWVSEKARGRGFGSQLMAHIERAAIRAGCSHAYLDTFSFQAPEFYKKLGYTVFGELESYPAGNTRYFLRKRLILPEGNR